MAPVAAALISATILTAVFTVMWRNYGERWLGLWAIGAGLWMVRYAMALILGDVRYEASAQLLPLLVILRGLFLVWGACALEGRALPQAWAFVFAADIGLLLAEWWAGGLVLLGAPGVIHYMVFGSATVWSGLIVLRSRRALGSASVIVAIGLIAIGITNLSFPWASQLETLSPMLFTVAHAAQLSTGFGALMMFFGRATAERDAANVRLEAALAKALSGYLPICAHCKSIRDAGGEWQPLERYFSRRHDTAFSHGICPSCEQLHYGDLMRDEE